MLVLQVADWLTPIELPWVTSAFASFLGEGEEKVRREKPGPKGSSMWEVLAVYVGVAVRLFLLCKGSTKGKLTLHRKCNVIYK